MSQNQAIPNNPLKENLRWMIATIIEEAHDKILTEDMDRIMDLIEKYKHQTSEGRR